VTALNPQSHSRTQRGLDQARRVISMSREEGKGGTSVAAMAGRRTKMAIKATR